MTRFPISSFIILVLLESCAAAQPQHPGRSSFTGTRLDVDINGNVIVADDEKNIVRLLSRDFERVAEVGGSGWGDDQFDRPAGIWARNGIDIFVADYGNHRIQRFDRKLAFISSFSTRERQNPDERFGYPTDVAVSRLGDLFICDSENGRVLKVVGFSKVEKTFGGFDAGKGRLRKPNQLDLGPNDNVYVQDGNRIVVFDNFGNFVHVLGEGLFTSDVQLFADENGAVVLGDGTVSFFDRDDRLLMTIGLDMLSVKEPRAFLFHRGNGYFLTADGIMVTPDPREAQLK